MQIVNQKPTDAKVVDELTLTAFCKQFGVPKR
jgi:hypothetical protein